MAKIQVEMCRLGTDGTEKTAREKEMNFLCRTFWRYNYSLENANLVVYVEQKRRIFSNWPLFLI